MSDIPDDADAILADLAQGLKELGDSAEDYAHRRDMYDGTAAEPIAHPSLEKLLAKYGKSFGLNYAAVPVDALVDRVDLAALTVAGDDALAARLKADFYDVNELADDADDYHTKAAALGDYYAIAWPKPQDGDAPAGEVELFGKSPLTTRIVYQAENNRLPEFAITRWPKRKGWRATLYYNNATVDFISEQGQGDDVGLYRRFEHVEGDDGLTDNPFGFPVFHFRPDAKPYGRPVNERAYGAQAAITKINATHMAAVDYLGYPLRYALLDPAAEVDDDIGEDFNDDGTAAPAADGKSNVVSPDSTNLKNAPGSAWLLSGVKSVGQFEPAEATPFLEAEAFQIRAAATLTRTPLYEFDLEGQGAAPSGEARRRADGPITKHAEKIKGTFGATWGQIGAFVLKCWGLGDGKPVTAVWMPSELATDKDGLELVGLKVANGVPPRDALLEAGYTVEQVDDWLPEGGPPVTGALLVSLAASLASLGQAKTLGVVSDEDIRLLFPTVLLGAAPEPPPAPEPAPAPIIVAPGDPLVDPLAEPLPV